MHSITDFTLVDKGYPYKLLGEDPQLPARATYLFGPPASRISGRNAAGTTANATDRPGGFGCGYFRAHNRSGSTAGVGVGVLVPNALWKLGFWDNSASTFTDDTADAQSADSGTPKVPLGDIGANTDDGIVIVSEVPFNAVSLRIGTAEAGGGNTPVHSFQFSNAAGTAWVTLTTGDLLVNDYSANVAATTTNATERVVAWAPTMDWGRVTAIGTVPVGMYAFKIASSTTPDTTAAVADSVGIARIYFPTEGITDAGTPAYNNNLFQDFGAKAFVLGQDDFQPKGGTGTYGSAVVALFGTANQQNGVTALLRLL